MREAAGILVEPGAVDGALRALQGRRALGGSRRAAAGGRGRRGAAAGCRRCHRAAVLAVAAAVLHARLGPLMTLLQPGQRRLGVRAALDSGGSEEHDRILDLLGLETAERLEILCKNADGPGLFALEKLAIQVGKVMIRHGSSTLSLPRAGPGVGV